MTKRKSEIVAPEDVLKEWPNNLRGLTLAFPRNWDDLDPNDHVLILERTIKTANESHGLVVNYKKGVKINTTWTRFHRNLLVRQLDLHEFYAGIIPNDLITIIVEYIIPVEEAICVGKGAEGSISECSYWSYMNYCTCKLYDILWVFTGSSYFMYDRDKEELYITHDTYKAEYIAADDFTKRDPYCFEQLLWNSSTHKWKCSTLVTVIPGSHHLIPNGNRYKPALSTVLRSVVH